MICSVHQFAEHRLDLSANWNRKILLPKTSKGFFMYESTFFAKRNNEKKHFLLLFLLFVIVSHVLLF